MKAVAGLFGQKTLRGITEKMLVSKTNEIRSKLGDRAMLRAIHFVRENERVRDLFKALRKDDIEGFLSVVRESGNSSATLLQNCYSVTDVKEQGIPLACAVAESVVGEKGAFRVHGGGFAGTIQAYVPLEKEKLFVKKMSESFGKESVTKLRIRPYGAVKVF
jgi:galactokinase